MKSLVRKNIEKVTAYKAGKPIEETKRELGLKEVIKLASNENPIGASPLAVRAIKKAASGINRYPDSQGFYLKKKLAASFHLTEENIVLGNGSDELIDVIIKTFVEDDEHVLTADITFLEYKIISGVNGRKVVEVPLNGFKFDLDGLRKRITAKTKLIFIANPNNPTGTYVNKKEVERFIRGLPPQVLVVFDEAYDTFIDVDDFPRSPGLIKKGNVIVLKTFSKAFGLAGVRIGYALANKRLISYMERVRQPFNVNLLAQAAAIAALDDREFLGKTRDVILRGKDYICSCLEEMGVLYVPSVANFVLIDTKKDALIVFRQMLKMGVIVRDMRQYGLDSFIRVTIGTERENRRFISALKKTLQK